jgi:hypothetical protein
LLRVQHNDIDQSVARHYANTFLTQYLHTNLHKTAPHNQPAQPTRTTNSGANNNMGTERTRELRRRRHRKKAVIKLTKRAEKGSKADKAIVADKLRKLTPGASVIIERLGIG